MKPLPLLLALLILSESFSSSYVGGNAFFSAEKSLYAWNANAHLPGTEGWEALLSPEVCAKLTAFSKAQGFDRIYLYIGSLQWDYPAYENATLPYEENLSTCIRMLERTAWRFGPSPTSMMTQTS